MSKRAVAVVLLFFLVIVLISASCWQSAAGPSSATTISTNTTPVPYNIQETRSADATSTYGADLFIQQLTAMAEDGSQP
jgi:hypothetical protein